MSIVDRKKSPSSILKTPSNRVISKKVSRTQIPQLHPAELELFQDYRSWMQAKKKISSSNSDSKSLEEYRFEEYHFVEEPVRFHFHDDYGMHQFRPWKNAILYEFLNKQVPVGFCERASRGMKYSDDEVYNLSSEKDLIDSFLKENLL